MNKMQLEKLLIEKWGYPDYLASKTAQDILQMDSDLYAAFLDWNQSGLLPEYNVGSYTISGLITIYHLEPVAAFLQLNWLKKDFSKAEYALLHRK